MVTLSAFTPVTHATTPTTGTITITPTSGPPTYYFEDGLSFYSTLVTVTGTGFPDGQGGPSGLTGIDICFVSTTYTASIGCANGIDLANHRYLTNPTIASNLGADMVEADANGNFQVQFYAPIAYGGAYNVYAYYTPSSGVPVMTPTVTFTITPEMSVIDQTTFTNSGIPGQPFDIIVVGMGAASASAGEGIQLIPSSFFTGTWGGLTVGSVLGNNQGVFEEDAGTWVTGDVVAGTTTLSTNLVQTDNLLALGVNAIVGDYLTYLTGPAAGTNAQITANTATTLTATFAGCAANACLGDSFIVSTSSTVVSIGAAVLPTLPSGTISMEALGLTTGTIASAKFTTTPSILLTSYGTPAAGCPSPSNPVILSIPTAAGNKFCMAGVGFAKSSTIANQGSVTVGGATTIESAITTTSTGSFGPIPVTLGSATAVGPLAITFDGMTFNYTNGNIQSPGVLLGSNPGQGALTFTYDSSTASSSKGYVGDTVNIFGFGYTCTAFVGAGAGSCTAPPVTPVFQFGGAAITTTLAFAEDANGAFEVSFAVPALPTTTPACVAATATCYKVHDVSGLLSANVIASTSTAGTTATTIFDSTNPFIVGDVGDYLTFTAGPAAGQTAQITAFVAANEVDVTPLTIAPGLHTYTVNTVTVTSNTAPDETFQIVPEATFNGPIGLAPDAFNSFGFTQVVFVDGFATTDASITVSMNGVAWATCPSAECIMSNTFAAADGGLIQLTLGPIGVTPVPDFPAGTYSVNASGSTSGNWAVTTNTLTILPIQALTGEVNCLAYFAQDCISALSVNTGSVGQSVALVSSSKGGLHGLNASTAYTIMWDGTDNVGSFTSTASGTVPVGTSFTVPAGTSGFHIVDIDQSGHSVLYGNQLTRGEQFGLSVLAGAFCPAVLGSSPPCDLLFNLLPVLTATPSLLAAGQSANVVGSGLPSSTLLYLTDPATSVAYATFTSTSTGGVPSGVTFTVPQLQTCVAGPPLVCPASAVSGSELGTLFKWTIVNSQGDVVGFLQWVLGASLTLSASSGAASSSLVLTANGLNAGDSPYDVVFNCIPNNNAPFTCSGTSTNSAAPNQVVGALIPNTLGAASTTITIPAGTPSGTYVIQLVGPSLTASWDLAAPPSFTVGICSTCGFGTSSLTPGSPSQATLNENPDISLTYTDATTQSITFVGYAVVTNALGEVVLYTTASATLAPSSSQTLYFVLAGLASASYTVSIYAISSNGVVLSTTTTTTAVIS